ncbi:hypothetical protein D3C72_1755130 [compost metagenome]
MNMIRMIRHLQLVHRLDGQHAPMFRKQVNERFSKGCFPGTGAAKNDDILATLYRQHEEVHPVFFFMITLQRFLPLFQLQSSSDHRLRLAEPATINIPL